MAVPQKIRCRSMMERRLERVDNRLNLSMDNCSNHNVGAVNSVMSLATEVGAVFDDDVQREVDYKTGILNIGRQDAKIETFAETMIKEKGSVENALLHVVSSVDKMLPDFVDSFINRGARTSVQDSDLMTPLHYAVKRNKIDIVIKLLENDALPGLRDKDGTLPLKIALDNRKDDMCALLIQYMGNDVVRRLFLSCDDKPAEFSFHELLQYEPCMQKTITAVLDCLIDNDKFSEKKTVYYNLLDIDEDGRTPNHPDFNMTSKSPYQIIARKRNKDIIYHDAVRMLTRKKWKAYARVRYLMNLFVYAVSLTCLTFCSIVAVETPDPTVYFSRGYDGLQVARAVCECLSITFVFVTFCKEMVQFARHRMDYARDLFNFIDVAACILLLTVIPLRFTHKNEQWFVFAFGYLLWTIRISKFAAVSRKTGVYTEALSKILKFDFTQFFVVFAVVLIAFGGSFYLALRGDNNLDKYHETRGVSQFFMFLYLVTCIVVLLNILIAQLADTNQKIQQDVQRELEASRAFIVQRVELNTFLFTKDWRKSKYTESVEVPEHNDLEKWDCPPLKEMNKHVEDIWLSIGFHKADLKGVKLRLLRQEHSLLQIQDKLTTLIAMQRRNSLNESANESIQSTNSERNRRILK